MIMRKKVIYAFLILSLIHIVPTNTFWWWFTALESPQEPKTAVVTGLREGILWLWGIKAIKLNGEKIKAYEEAGKLERSQEEIQSPIYLPGIAQNKYILNRDIQPLSLLTAYVLLSHVLNKNAQNSIDEQNKQTLNNNRIPSLNELKANYNKLKQQNAGQNAFSIVTEEWSNQLIQKKSWEAIKLQVPEERYPSIDNKKLEDFLKEEAQQPTHYAFPFAPSSAPVVKVFSQKKAYEEPTVWDDEKIKEYYKTKQNAYILSGWAWWNFLFSYTDFILESLKENEKRAKRGYEGGKAFLETLAAFKGLACNRELENLDNVIAIHELLAAFKEYETFRSRIEQSNKQTGLSNSFHAMYNKSELLNIKEGDDPVEVFLNSKIRTIEEQIAREKEHSTLFPAVDNNMYELLLKERAARNARNNFNKSLEKVKAISDGFKDKVTLPKFRSVWNGQLTNFENE